MTRFAFTIEATGGDVDHGGMLSAGTDIEETRELHRFFQNAIVGRLSLRLRGTLNG